MENKQKPSMILFVPDHHSFNKLSGIAFKEHMLEWPIYKRGEPEEVVSEEWALIYRTALRALTMIHPFRVKISMRVDLERKFLMLTRRTWGEIFFLEDGNRVTTLMFSHHTKRESIPFDDITDWVEIERPYGNQNQWTEKVITRLVQWPVDRWVAFFKGRLRKRARFFQKKADAKRQDVLELEESAKKILCCIAESASNG